MEGNANKQRQLQGNNGEGLKINVKAHNTSSIYRADSARQLQGNDIGLGVEVNNVPVNNRKSFIAVCCEKFLCCFRTTRVQKGALNQGEDIHQGDGDATFFGNGSQSVAGIEEEVKKSNLQNDLVDGFEKSDFLNGLFYNQKTKQNKAAKGGVNENFRLVKKGLQRQNGLKHEVGNYAEFPPQKPSRLQKVDDNNRSSSGDIDSRRSLNQSESNSVISSIQRNLYDSYGDSISPVGDNFRHKEAVATGWVGTTLSPVEKGLQRQDGLKPKAIKQANTRNQELKSEKKIENSHIGPSGVDVEVVSNAGNEGFKSSHSSSLNSSVCSSVHSNKAQWICKKHGNPESSNPNESFDSNKAQHSKCTKELKQGSLYPKINILPSAEFKQEKKESNVKNKNFLFVPNGNLNRQSNRIGSSSPREGLVK